MLLFFYQTLFATEKKIIINLLAQKYSTYKEIIQHPLLIIRVPVVLNVSVFTRVGM
jgi:hypothetical protein